MLKEQITDKVDTSVDPMTVVAKGAALYASSLNREAIAPPANSNFVELEINYDSSTVETDALINVKIKDLDKLNGEKIFAQIFVVFVQIF